MKRSALILAILICCATSASSDSPKRPRIFGIATVEIYVTALSEASFFYSHVIPSTRPCLWCEEFPHALITVPVNDMQFVKLSKLSSPARSSLLAEVSFWTDDITGLKRFLTSNNIAFKTAGRASDGPIEVTDPEGHALEFLQPRPVSWLSPLTASGLRLIHAGFIVRDRTATEHFYKDILGFRPYWHGGMKDDQTDWVSLQVPDGTDWLEFMVNVRPDADQRLRGIMNHIAIGVTDIHATQKRLEEAGVKLTEEPKIGRDGKWQLNLYDPDETRVEFMEFTPVQKPCCSEYTGPHPKP